MKKNLNGLFKNYYCLEIRILGRIIVVKDIVVHEVLLH